MFVSNKNMEIKIPQHHIFPQPLRKEIFDKTGHSLPEWEIYVPKRHDLAWSIVLSYLMSTNYREPGDISRRLKALTGIDENSELVNKSIRRFNPFRNRCSCFYDKILKTVVNNFRKHVEWNNLSSVPDKLSFASDALQCPILLIRDYSKLGNHEIFSKTKKRNQKSSYIILIESTFKDFDDPTLNVIVYNFMIDGILGERMKKAALQYHLNETDIPKKIIKKLTSVVSDEDTFIKAVLNSKYKDVVLDVYKSPYVVLKLSEAGYEMDPKAIDSDGLSGLYYALTLKNPEILYKLYYFAADNCCQDEVSFRNPDPNIVSNLQYIEDLLLDNMSKLKYSNYHEEYSDIKTKFKELLRLNRFLIELNRKFLEIKNRLNYYESTSDIVFEAIKRRDVLVSLLDTYKKFFSYQDDSSLPPIDDYIFHKNYYISVDMVTAILFFDNITLLKERLVLDNYEEIKIHEEKKKDGDLKNDGNLKNDGDLKNDGELKKGGEFKNDGDLKNDEDKTVKEIKTDTPFSEIESSFFFFLLHNLVFEKLKPIRTIRDLASNILKTVYIFPYKYRFDNFNKLDNFCKILRAINIGPGNVVNNIPECEIYSILCSHPNIKDAISLSRLINYIETIKKMRITDIKSVLVIERVLQVIGECLAPEEKEDFSFRRFLSLCLSKEIVQKFRRLRNLLTHLPSYIYPAKIECEKNISLFRSILNEIRKIEKYFKPAYHIIALSFLVYLGDKFEESVKDLRHSDSYTFVHSSFFKDSVSLSVTLPSDYFDQVRSNCHDFLKTALINLEGEIKDEYLSQKDNLEDSKKKVIYLLWPLKWLLELLQQCQMHGVANLLDTFKELESSYSLITLKEKTDIFIKQCYDLLPIFNVVQKRNKTCAVESIQHIDHFKNILQGSILSDKEKDEIRKDIPERIKQQVSMKDKLIRSIDERSPLKVDVNSAEFELTYLPKAKMRDLRNLYESNDSYVLTVLKTQDPIAELEEIFSKNKADKKKYDALCETMQFSEKSRKKLGKLVAGQRRKFHTQANNLLSLHNRILLLKTIIIDEDEEIRRLWFKIKREQSQQLIVEKIVRRYVKDFQFQAAVQMLLLDCINLSQIVKLPKTMWIKSSKLYQGINMRSIISHGNPLVETVCLSLDPQELPSEIVNKILILIKDEDAVKAIIELHELASNDFTKLIKIINCDEKDDYCELRNRIKNCNEWQNYAHFLSYSHRDNLL